jgi:hypothetical protein
MRKLGTVQLFAVGALTPALTGAPQAANARAPDVTSAAVGSPDVASPSWDAARARLQSAMLTLSLRDKLKIGADRIRLSANTVRRLPPPKPMPGGHYSASCDVQCRRNLYRPNTARPTGSDIRLKRDIAQVARLENGISVSLPLER